MSPIIRPLAPADLPLLQAHLTRVRAKPGCGNVHMLRFEPEAPAGSSTAATNSMQRSLGQAGWQRWFAAVSEDGDRICGHVCLEGDSTQAGVHRCELGIGVEYGYRGRGLGRRLLQAGVYFARQTPSLNWIDLRVFVQNTPARVLAIQLGFIEVGTVRDRFRLDGHSIDEIHMTLNVARALRTGTNRQEAL